MGAVMNGASMIGVVLVVSSVPMTAQEVPTMTLEEAIDIALDRNPQYLSALAQFDATTVGIRSAYGAFFPTLSANVQWNGNSRTTLSGTDDFGQTVTLPEPVSVRSSSANQSFSSSLTLFDGFQNVNRLSAARHDVSASNAAVDVQSLQMTLDVSQAFFDAILAQRLVVVEQQLLASAEEQLNANQRLFRIASVTQVEILGAQVDVASRQQNLDTQLAEAHKARLRVLQTLGVLGEVTEFDPVGGFPAVFDPSVLDVDELVQRAFDANPSVAQAFSQEASARSSAAAAKGSWLPTVSLNASWARQLSARDFGAVFEFNPTQNRGYNFGIQVGWQIFNGFDRSFQIANANAQLRQAEEGARISRLELEQQVRSAYIDFLSAYDALQIQQRSTALSRQRVVFAGEQFRQSAIAFTNLQTIIDNAAGQERSLVQAEYNFATRLVMLERRVGEQIRTQG